VVWYLIFSVLVILYQPLPSYNIKYNFLFYIKSKPEEETLYSKSSLQHPVSSSVAEKSLSLPGKHFWICRFRFKFVVFNATFNNTSVISWQ
jgi:hypothetical protein